MEDGVFFHNIMLEKWWRVGSVSVGYCNLKREHLEV